MQGADRALVGQTGGADENAPPHTSLAAQSLADLVSRLGEPVPESDSNDADVVWARPDEEEGRVRAAFSGETCAHLAEVSFMS